jgi:predicted XRE-type DNA-binding protein
MRKSKTKKESKNDFEFFTGSGNVFKDLGFSDEEAESLMVRSNLMVAITDILDKRGLTTTEAAKVLGVKPPRISELRRDPGKFSIDLLLKYLKRLGKRVEVVVKDDHKVA